jgi:hypothetical protein
MQRFGQALDHIAGFVNLAALDRRVPAKGRANVDWFVCRDTDSRLNCQELLAVEEWLRSGQPFHVMRDHIYHMELMLAEMWGGAAGVLPNLRARALANSFRALARKGVGAIASALKWICE